jgi:hypothetical protein
VAVKEIVGSKGNEGSFEISEPSGWELSKKKFNRVDEGRLDITKREMKGWGVPADFGTKVDVGEGAVSC